MYNLIMRYLMTVTYDGKNYSGYQIQPNADTIQAQLEKSILIITKQNVTCTASGRTDAKVSAYCQPVHFDIDSQLNEKKFLHSINGILPSDIRVLNIKPSKLHARFSAKKKTYIYKMHLSNIDLPLKSQSLRISPNINIRAMKRFIRLLKGTHDFIGFRASGGENDTTIRTIFSIKLKKHNDDLIFSVTGNGFLYKMVRNIVGTMLSIGENKRKLSTIKPTLFTTFKATNTAKPDYLYLYNVEYHKK